MRQLDLKGTPKTPSVLFDAEKGLLEIKGRSIPENSLVFYKPLNNWLKDYGKEPSKQTIFEVKLEYYNTSSSKCLLDLFKTLEKLNEEGKTSVKVHWYYETDDEDMLEAGEDYQAIIPLTFEIIEVEEI